MGAEEREVKGLWCGSPHGAQRNAGQCASPGLRFAPSGLLESCAPRRHRLQCARKFIGSRRRLRGVWQSWPAHAPAIGSTTRLPAGDWKVSTSSSASSNRKRSTNSACKGKPISVASMQSSSFPSPSRTGGCRSPCAKRRRLPACWPIRISEGKAVAVHCRAGIGRSSLIAACALVCSGTSPIAAFESIGKVRGVRVPDTDGQRDWVVAFREAIVTTPDEERGQ
jgi:hypothetical protein